MGIDKHIEFIDKDTTRSLNAKKVIKSLIRITNDIQFLDFNENEVTEILHYVSDLKLTTKKRMRQEDAKQIYNNQNKQQTY